MATVTEMKRPKSEAAGGDVAVGTVMEFRIGEGAASLQLSSCFGRDDDLAVWNDVLDKMRLAGNRQAAIADMESFAHGIVIQRRERQDACDLYERAEKTHAEQMAAIEARIEALQAEASKIATDDEAAFAGSGKRGDYKISQTASQRIARTRSMIDHEKAEADKLNAMRDGALNNHDASIRSFDKKIEWFESEIERLRPLTE